MRKVKTLIINTMFKYTNIIFVFVVTLLFQIACTQAQDFMDSSDLAAFTNPVADHVIYYGEDEFQYGELRLPATDGPHPVIVFIHGGCWLADFDITHSRKLVAAFTAAGFATWNVEYRRVGNPGGGWPGTFDDIARGTDHLALIAEDFDLDLGRVLISGHSAGGHLAIWSSNRPEQWPTKIKPAALLAMAPAPDLEYVHQQGVCGNVIDRLMGGSPEQVPERYVFGSGISRLPMDIPQYIVIGKHDRDWAVVGRRYVEAAVQSGNSPQVIIAEESGHFEMIDPDSSSWPLILQTAKSALKIPGSVE
jgi:acetyl esterase/lipase